MATPAQLNAVLEQLAPGNAELQAAFRADSELMGVLTEYVDTRVKIAQHEQALADYSAKEPSKTLPGSGIGGTGILEKPNPDWTAWNEKKRKAQETLRLYYKQGIPAAGELPALKELSSDEDAFHARLGAATRRVQTAYTKAAGEGPSATNPPDLVWFPTETAGEERAHVYDEGAGTYVPAKDAQGNPMPVRKVAQPQQPTPRVAEGTQSWELKYDDESKTWWQVPTRARADGSFEFDTSRKPVPATGMPAGQPDLTILDGVPYTRVGNVLKPLEGYAKPPMTRFDAQGRGFYSSDGGKTWQPSTGAPGTPQTITSGGFVYPLDEQGLPLPDRAVKLNEQEQTQVVEGYLVRYDPNTKQVERTDLYTPEQRGRLEQTTDLGLRTRQQELENAQRLQDPVAEYQRQVQVQQQQATTYRDQLNDKVLRGELSVEDASTQFDRWWDQNVEARLTPYRTMAEGAYRKEQNEYQQRQAAEQARVDAINRQREQTAYAAGEKARQDLMTLAPQGRSPEFLNQLAQNVSTIGQPLPGGPAQHGGGMRFSPESLSLDAVKRSQPSLTGVGQAAVARALAQISPAAAQSVGAPPPQVPSLPQFQDFMGRAPFQIPNPALPVPGRAALDLGNPANAALLGLPVQPGYAGTQYQGGRVEAPWQIPQG